MRPVSTYTQCNLSPIAWFAITAATVESTPPLQAILLCRRFHPSFFERLFNERCCIEHQASLPLTSASICLTLATWSVYSALEQQHRSHCQVPEFELLDNQHCLLCQHQRLLLEHQVATVQSIVGCRKELCHRMEHRLLAL